MEHLKITKGKLCCLLNKAHMKLQTILEQTTKTTQVVFARVITNLEFHETLLYCTDCSCTTTSRHLNHTVWHSILVLHLSKMNFQLGFVAKRHWLAFLSDFRFECQIFVSSRQKEPDSWLQKKRLIFSTHESYTTSSAFCPASICCVPMC